MASRIESPVQDAATLCALPAPVAFLVADGARQLLVHAAQAIDNAIHTHGVSASVAFPNTAYYLPVIYALTGTRVETLGSLQLALADANGLIPPEGAFQGDALDPGAAARIAAEALQALHYVAGEMPPRVGIWLGAADDMLLREKGIEFVDGSVPGFAIVIGAAPSCRQAVEIARRLQEKGIYAFIAGSAGGTSCTLQMPRSKSRSASNARTRRL